MPLLVRRATLVPALLAVPLLAVPLVSVPLAASAGDGPRPASPRADDLPGETIVAVEGDAAFGFTVRRLDGSTEHPPTLSESVAECHEYDDPTQVAVCVAEVETTFAGLADVQRSLRWAFAQPPGRG